MRLSCSSLGRLGSEVDLQAVSERGEGMSMSKFPRYQCFTCGKTMKKYYLKGGKHFCFEHWDIWG